MELKIRDRDTERDKRDSEILFSVYLHETAIMKVNAGQLSYANVHNQYYM